MKRPSKISVDILKDDNVISVENLSESFNAFNLKTMKKGKLFRGPNWTAYNKCNLGSIPRKVEKSIVDDTKMQTKMAFTTQSERFCNSLHHDIKNPGPGAYNLGKPFDLTGTTVSFYSTKGFGNGFTSGSERFDNNKLFYNKFLPGPGEYSHNTQGSLAYDLNKNTYGKGAYNTKRTKSLAIQRTTPGPGYYNPKFINNTVEANKSSFFSSNIQRFNQMDKKKIPGPGYYFRDISNVNSIKNPNSESHFFISKSIEKDDPLKRLDIKTIQSKEDIKYRLIGKKGKLINSTPQNSDSDFIRKANLMVNKKDIFRIKNKPLHKTKSSELLPNVSPIQIRNSKVNDDKGYEYIHQLIDKEPKQERFKLSPERWPKKEEFKNPGPAYYNPRMQNSKLSFNSNKNKFIITSGKMNIDMHCVADYEIN